MLRSFHIKGLYGVKNNDVLVRFNEDLTIIVGQNGTGKTTILNMLNAILGKAFDRLLAYDFESITLESDEGDIRVISRPESIIVKRVDVAKALQTLSEDLPIRLTSEVVDKLHQEINKDEPIVVADIREDDLERQFRTLLASLYLELPRERDERRLTRDYIRLFRRFAFNVPSIYFPTYRRLETDLAELLREPMAMGMRIPSFARPTIEESLSEYAQHLGRIVIGFSNRDINEIVSRKWSEISQSEKEKLNELIGHIFLTMLDTSMNLQPTAILNTNTHALKSALEEMLTRTELLNPLKKNGEWTRTIQIFERNIDWASRFMTDRLDGAGGQLQIQQSNVFETSGDEVNELLRALSATFSMERLSRFEEMYRKTCNEVDAIKAPFRNLEENLKMFMRKSVDIKNGELKFQLDGKTLDYADLSAGEKQLVAMFVYTRLAMQPGAIVIIDEPELSLHVNWQRRFLSALVSDSQPMQYVVSTHSPFIIAKHRDYVNSLGPIGDEEDE